MAVAIDIGLMVKDGDELKHFAIASADKKII